MREANKETKDRDDFHPMQNIHLRLTRFTRNKDIKIRKVIGAMIRTMGSI